MRHLARLRLSALNIVGFARQRFSHNPALGISGPAAQPPVVRLGTRLAACKRRSSPHLTQGCFKSQSGFVENLTQTTRSGYVRGSLV